MMSLILKHHHNMTQSYNTAVTIFKKAEGKRYVDWI